MAAIILCRQVDGTPRSPAIVRMGRGGAILHRGSRTFAHQSAALTWAQHGDVALKDPSVLVREQQDAPTLAELIRWCINTFETISKWQRGKQSHLQFLERHKLGESKRLAPHDADAH